MKKLITLCLALACLFCLNTAEAQLPDGSIAPDFTAEDINGVTWNLYDILDEGKAVILDISATWCGPCWSYHQGGNLETIYETYGPDGTDEIMVFMIEGDASTTLDDLYGTGSNTTGDWVTGTLYPIIDDASIFSAYQCTYYPTIFTICPDKTLVESGQTSVANHYDISQECATAFGTNNVRVMNLTTPSGLCDGVTTFTPEVDMQNLGTAVVTSATLQATFNGSPIGDPFIYSGSMGTFGIETLALNEIELSEGGELGVEVVDVNATTDDDESDNSDSEDVFVISVTSVTDTLLVSILTDAYGEEIYWEVLDDAGNILQWGGNEDAEPGAQQFPNLTGGYDSNTQYDETVVVPANGCYDFRFIDDYGDGLYNSGFIKLFDNEGNELFNQGPGDFIDVHNPFKADFMTSSNTQIDNLTTLSVFPSPVQETLNVRFGLLESTQLSVNVFNAFGQKVTSIATTNYAAGSNNLTINASDMPNGIYFVTLQSDNQSITKKFFVSK